MTGAAGESCLLIHLRSITKPPQLGCDRQSTAGCHHRPRLRLELLGWVLTDVLARFQLYPKVNQTFAQCVT